MGKLPVCLLAIEGFQEDFLAIVPVLKLAA
jgi:hypothetical protein